MLKNHLKLAIRNLFKRKGYSLLNIFGLAIGITCCLLIFQYVAYERSYDSFPPKAGQILRLRLDSWQKGKLDWQSATVYPAIAAAMKKEFPEVEMTCRLIDAEFLLANDRNNVKVNETKGYFADPSALQMLGVTLLQGNPATALNGPDKLLLSQTAAKKFFGNEDPMGKILTMKNGKWRHLEVTGIFKDYPVNSHLIINHLASYATLAKQAQDNNGDLSNESENSWDWYDFYTYVQLRPGADWHSLQAKLPAFCDRHLNNIEFRKKNNLRNELALVPLTDIHLKSNYNQEAESNGNGRAVSFLFLIAFFIIVIAWVNYTNLATARSLERAREVGVRKVLGAMRGDLILQFLMESFLLNIVSLVIAITAAYALTPAFNQLVGSDNAAPFRLPAIYALGFTGLFLTGTLISGSYPAFILSGYNPLAVLKGIFRNSTGGQMLRRSLIVGQFAVSVILIAGTILVYQQVQYMRGQTLGVNISQTLVVEGAGSLSNEEYGNVFQPFKTDLLTQPNIHSVTASSDVMSKEIYWTNRVRRVDRESKNSVTLFQLAVDYDFLPSYEMKLPAGRNFSPDYGTDKKAAIINERAADLLGFNNAKEAIGGKLKRGRDTLTIVGVTADYHHLGLQKAIDPMLIMLSPTVRSYYSIKIGQGRSMQQTLADIEKKWAAHFPHDPFNYFFLDESYNQQYKSDSRFGKVFGIFACLAIIIACFGLLGLSAYNVLQRTKEIGIRKVLGASTGHLVVLLSKEFFRLVLVSLLISIPLTWWVMHGWLQDFAYRISIQWWVFVIAGFLAVFIALATVGLQALRAAIANPANSLRTE